MSHFVLWVVCAVAFMTLAPGGASAKRESSSFGRSHHQKAAPSSQVPELDANVAFSALALLGGTAVLLRARARRRLAA